MMSDAILALLWVLTAAIVAVIGLLVYMGETMTKTFDDIQGQIQAIKTTVDEVAIDVADLVARLGSGSAPDGGLTKDEAAQIANELGELGTKLSDVAAEYTPPVTPPVTLPGDQGEGSDGSGQTENQ